MGKIADAFSKHEYIERLRKEKSAISVLGNIDPTINPIENPGCAAMVGEMVEEMFTKSDSIFETKFLNNYLDEN